MIFVSDAERIFNLSIKVDKSMKSFDELLVKHNLFPNTEVHSWLRNMEFFVSYETEIINNGVFFTDSNGLGLLERNSMSRDEEFESDTVSLGSRLFPVTTVAMIQD